jgi:hypothetical protein
VIFLRKALLSMRDMVSPRRWVNEEKGIFYLAPPG